MKTEAFLDGIPEDLHVLFNKKVGEILKAAGLDESKDDIVQQCGGIRIRIYEAGEYIDKTTGEKREHDKGIDLKQGTISLHVAASDVAQLLHWCRANKPLNEKLNERLDEEKTLLDRIGF